MSGEAYKAFGDNGGERGPQGDHGDTGATGATGPQGESGKDWRLGGWALARLVAFVIVAVAAMYSAGRTYAISADNKAALEQIKQESADRRDQICLSSEREHKRNVDELRSTYLYLANLTGDEARSTLNRFIIANIPKTEDIAHTDVAPDFCDEPGVQAEALYTRTHGAEGLPPIGLPEPDPVVPDRPDKVDRLIRDLGNQKPVLQGGK